MSTEATTIEDAASFVHELNERRKAEEDVLSPSDVSTESESTPQGAIDPVTGEINWDCPCLAEMVKPPCGDSFKAAFSCFVYSQTEPKGMDCVDKFKDMQMCFKENPEIYGRDDVDDEDDEEEK